MIGVWAKGLSGSSIVTHHFRKSIQYSDSAKNPHVPACYLAQLYQSITEIRDLRDFCTEKQIGTNSGEPTRSTRAESSKELRRVKYLPDEFFVGLSDENRFYGKVQRQIGSVTPRLNLENRLFKSASLQLKSTQHHGRLSTGSKSPTKSDNSPHVMTQVDRLRADWNGIRISIIDTGVDFKNHPALGVYFGLGCLIGNGTDLIGGDDIATDGAGHGTQVSGIFAGMLISQAQRELSLAYTAFSVLGRSAEQGVIVTGAAGNDGDVDLSGVRTSDGYNVISVSSVENYLEPVFVDGGRRDRDAGPGLTWELGVKPQLNVPGGSIPSTFPLDRGDAIPSGTPMANLLAALY
ncbi:hypothetical protein BJ742DRAFT_867890 [Cladochytrium replicatum]|nr:hypothetical protein BJ742DRAFT_867890 [Cladochytrium replicatum]